MSIRAGRVLNIIKRHPGLSYVAVGQIGATVLGAVFWLVVTRLLDPSGYGEVSWLFYTTSLASIVCLMGLGTTIVTYYPKEGDEDLIANAILVVLISSLLVGATMALLLEPLAGLMVIGFSLFSIALSTELAKRRYKRYMWAWIGTKLAALLLAVWMYSWLGLLGVLLGYIIPLLIFGGSSLRYLHKKDPSMEGIRRKMNFALKAFSTDITRTAVNSFDKILIGPIFGMATLGLYQLAYQIFMALSILPGILFSYLLPEKSAGTRTREVEVLGLIVSVIATILCIVLSPTIIPWLFPNFSKSIRLAQVMSLGLVPFTIVMVKMSELYAHERPGAILISYVGAFTIGITSLLILGTYFGSMGLATSTVLLQTVLALMLSLQARRA